MMSRLDFTDSFLEIQERPDSVIWIPGDVLSVEEADGTVLCRLAFIPFRWDRTIKSDSTISRKTGVLRLQARGTEILRVSAALNEDVSFVSAESEMLVPDGEANQLSVLKVAKNGSHWTITDDSGATRCMLENPKPELVNWSPQVQVIDSAWEYFSHPKISFYPDGETEVALHDCDRFFYGKFDSLPLAFVETDNRVASTFFSVKAGRNEHFSGTGERFARLDLSGRTIDYTNIDGLGVNSRKTYKNVPFYFSSAGYGCFIHTSHGMRSSFCDISARAVQHRLEHEHLDLFLTGGKGPADVVRNYQSITGTPPKMPLWSYGIWMSRMSYFSAVEVEGIGDRLRSEQFPCDVLHVDTGWFKEDWVCDWQFCEDRFPEPEKFMKRMKDKGFRITVWQTPNIGKENPLYELAQEKRYMAPILNEENLVMSDFSGQDFGGQIDLTNPDAVEWYKGMLKDILEKGAAAIKTDFGERIERNADYAGMSAEQLHNLYALLYQKAAFEVTEEVVDDEPMIWARAAWAGSQRYPVHWGGDAASSWDGMAASLRGGLHLGLSGFTYWSHDIPGFHGVPNFLRSRPSPELYMRWTQFGVFSSHMRYHGCFPREPWEYPEIIDSIRKWWQFRYALIPHIVEETEFCRNNGRPMIAAMAFDNPEDEAIWHVDDQYMFGRSMPIAIPDTNTVPLALYLGAEPQFATTNIWYKHIDLAPDNDRKLIFDPNNFWVKTHEAMFEACRKLADGRYLLGLSGLSPNLDVLSELRGAQNLMMDMVLHPDWVKEKLAEVDEVSFRAYERLYPYCVDEKGWCTHGYFMFRGPGKVGLAQCDTAAMIGVEMFEEFVVPSLENQCRFLDHTLYHVDGPEALRSVDSLLDIPELDALEWTPGPQVPQGGGACWYDLYRKIKAAGKSVQAVGIEPEEVKPLLDAVGPEGMYLMINFVSQKQVEYVEKVVKEYR